MKKERDWTNSSGFLMYKEDETIFKMLSAEDCKAVLLAVFAYSRGEESELEGIQEIGFDHIKKHLDQNREAYNEMVEKRREAAQIRWQREHEEESMQKDASAMQNDAKECTCMHMHDDASVCIEKTMQKDAQGMQNDAKDADNDYEYDYEYDNDNDIDNKDILSGKPDHASMIKEIVSYLNQKTGKSFRPGSKSTRRAINARIKEGFTINDFYQVIDKKVAEWGDNNQMEQYLRPETLFGTKFEGYLNQQFSGKKLSKNDEQLLKIQNGYYEDSNHDETGNSQDDGLFDWGIFETSSG